MSESKNSISAKDQTAEPVNFAERFTESELFNKIFHEGMDLVEQTATYLDGAGRRQSRDLGRLAAMAYATESMRLTTRLMQLASWLLLQRAVKDGEMTAQEAQKEKYRINLAEIGRQTKERGAEELPKDLIDLIARSFRLYERILHLDEMLRNEGQSDQGGSNPVSDQVSRLQAAFTGLGEAEG